MTLLPMGFFSHLENALVRHVNSKVKNDFWNTLNFFPRMDLTVWRWRCHRETALFNDTPICLNGQTLFMIWGAGVVNMYINSCIVNMIK